MTISHYGANTNFTSTIDATNYDLNSLFVSSYFASFQSPVISYDQTGNNVAKGTITFPRIGTYMGFLTGTPSNSNSSVTNYTMSLSYGAGLTAFTNNALFISSHFGGGGGSSNNTASTCGLLAVTSGQLTWDLFIKINGSDSTLLGVNCSIVGPI